MSARELARPVRWPWVAVAVFVTLAVVGVVGVLANGESVMEQVTYILAFAMFGLVGALILSRDPRNVIGGMMLWASVITACAFTAGELFTWLHGRGASADALVALGFLNTAGWLLGIIPVIFLLPLLFPDGRPPSSRWRPFLWLVLSCIGLLGLWIVLGSRGLSGSNEDITVTNPFHVEALGDGYAVDPVFAILFPSLFGLSVLSLILRFRRTDGEQRQQIKWVVFGVAAALVGTIASTALEGEGVISELIGGAAFLAFPLTIGVSVLRYRLYDLDVVVKKALVAAVIALLVIGVYVAIVSIAGVATTEVSAPVVFVIALALGVAFRPVARSARRIADRLVYGRRATPYEVLAEFSERVGDAYATDDVLGRMAAIMGGGVGAERARVWLRVGRELRLGSTWPSDDDGVRTLPLRGERLPEMPGEDLVEVRDRAELIGALSVTMPANDPMTPARAKLVEDLAAQAGLALRNVRLVEELKASQRRLVAAQDVERRRLERNIHDGAQQRLVALAVKARLARSLTERDAGRADEMLGQIEGDLHETLEELRDLARGIYPPLLADKGLRAALDAQARRAALPVDVSVPDDLGRFPAEVEAAVYFSCLEALQNIAKYAEASHATIELSNGHGALRFEVSDDGRGFDAAGAVEGTGLRGIADRLGAVGGSVEVTSAPGTGTRVAGTVPV